MFLQNVFKETWIFFLNLGLLMIFRPLKVVADLYYQVFSLVDREESCCYTGSVSKANLI